MANRKAKKLCVDDIRGFLERENESESEFELDSSSSGAYESSDEELSDSVNLDNSLQNISSQTPEHHFQWTKWDDNQADEDMFIHLNCYEYSAFMTNVCLLFQCLCSCSFQACVYGSVVRGQLCNQLF